MPNRHQLWDRLEGLNVRQVRCLANIIVLSLLTIPGSSCGTKIESDPDTGSREQILQLLNRQVEAWNVGALETFMLTY